jgi:chorismate mutase
VSTSETVRLRGIRGATTVESNTKDEILAATSELLSAIVQANELQEDDVASVLFSATQDLNAEFPALAARHMGWSHVALTCMQEMYVPGSLPMCVRILMHVNTTKRQDEVQFIYLRGAKALRPDLTGNQQ